MSAHDCKKSDSIRVGEVTVRLARTSEIAKWDRLMRKHHQLGFKRFAGRGLRYIIEIEGEWVGLSGWQTGSLKSAPRDQWIGWHRDQQWQRLHLVANNTRFALLCDAGRHPNLGSHALKLICARLSDDWQAVYGHELVLAETFVDPAHHRGHMYHAAGWHTVGQSAGFSRKGGAYTEAHDERKWLLVRPLRRDARRVLCAEGELAQRFERKGRASGRSVTELRSLHEELSGMRDFRRRQGRKHTLECSFTILVLAQLSGFSGSLAAAQFAGALSQAELAAVGGWRNPRTGLYEPPSKSTLHRVIQHTDTEQLSAVLSRITGHGERVAGAVAGDGKRIRGANRNGDSHHETVTLVAHGSGTPQASVSYHNEGEELEATRRLLSESDIAGRVITLDALHTTFDTVDLILDQGADYVLTLKDNAAAQLRKAQSMPWWSRRVRCYSEKLQKAHGRLEQRHVSVLEVDDPDRFGFTGVRQVFRIERDREQIKDPHSAGTETVYGITSVSAGRADAGQLLCWNRGHWTVEVNHHIRDRTFGEDTDLTRTGNGPGNRAMCNNIALALIFRHNRFESVPQALRHFNLNRREAIDALLSPI